MFGQKEDKKREILDNLFNDATRMSEYNMSKRRKLGNIKLQSKWRNAGILRYYPWTCFREFAKPRKSGTDVRC